MSIVTEVEEQISQIPKRKIKRLIKDPVKTAEAVNLTYVSDTQS